MQNFRKVTVILSFSGLIACGKKASDTVESTLTTGTTRTPGANSAVQASTVAELGLSGALQIKLPDALSSSSSAPSSLKLVGVKSVEACLMRESAKQLVQQIEDATNFLCHIEAEGKNIPWNTPALLDFSASEETPGLSEDEGLPLLGLYVKETEAGHVEVCICEGTSKETLKLSQAFKVTGSKSVSVGGKTLHVSKGQVQISQDMNEASIGLQSSFKGSIVFDGNYTEKDVSALSMETKFAMKVTGPMSYENNFAQKFSLASKDNGKTKVSISELGTWEDSVAGSFEFKKTSVGLFDAENGNVYYKYDDGPGTAEFSSQACVDSESNLLDDDCNGPKFQAGGVLHLDLAEVPPVLAANFTPDSPTGFDCKPASWSTVSLSNDAAVQEAHMACDKGAMAEAEAAGDSFMDCFNNPEYAESEVPATIEFETSTEDDFEAEIDQEIEGL